jgi:hypothetical protein
MKYLTIVFSLLLIMSCKKNNKNPEPTPEPDCDCNRVVQVNQFQSVGNCTGGNTYNWGSVITINDCTQIQINDNWSQCDGDVIPVMGECFSH